MLGILHPTYTPQHNGFNVLPPFKPSRKILILTNTEAVKAKRDPKAYKLADGGRIVP